MPIPNDQAWPGFHPGFDVESDVGTLTCAEGALLERAGPGTPMTSPLRLPWLDRGPVIPVIVIADATTAVSLARALVAGGLSALEVTLRTPAALGSIEAMVKAVPEAAIGAGTVRMPIDAARARDAGAAFAVSPGYTHDLGGACTDLGLPLLPGVATASEVMLAYADGHRFCKFFPAVAAGGIPVLQALAGPFPDVQFCPTGGLTETSASGFLALPTVPVCGGTWLTPPKLVAEHNWPAITELASRAAALG